MAASGAADCFARKVEAETEAERQRARGSLLRRLRRVALAGERPGLLEVEIATWIANPNEIEVLGPASQFLISHAKLSSNPALDFCTG